MRIAGAAQIAVARAVAVGAEAASLAEGLTLDSCNVEGTQFHLRFIYWAPKILLVRGWENVAGKLRQKW